MRQSSPQLSTARAEYATPESVRHVGKEGASNWALALINFESLESYATYRKRLLEDEGARANVAYAAETKCILVEDRTFLRPA